jgi:hypothetical protein
MSLAPHERLENIHSIEALISFQSIRGSTLSDHHRLLRIPTLKQQPARSIQKSSNDSQAGRYCVALDVSWTLLAGVQLRRDHVRHVCNGVCERQSERAFRVRR